MAIIKKIMGQITLKVIVDVVSTTYYYLLKPSASPVPAKPTVSPPPTYEETDYEGWQTTEPGYTSGDTRSLYITVRTIYSDGSFEYSSPSLSSSYEAAKEAYNRAQSAMSLAGDINQYFWNIPSAYSTNIPAGAYVTSISQNSFKSNPSGGNIIIQNTGLTIRNGTIQLASLTGQALAFYNPSTNTAQLIIGANGVLQSGNFVYTSGTYSDSGTKIDLTNGSIYTPGFRTDGSNTYIRGEINALSGKIGNNNSNYWTIGNNYNYDQTASAALISHGTAFIQLDTSNTWRLSTDRIHTAWNGTDNSAALMFPKDGNTYWDWGIHSPHKTNNVWKDKFIYARKYTNTTDDDFTNRDNLSNDIDDDSGLWTYQFYVDKNGSIYARNFYLLNEDGTPGSNIGGQDAVYLLKSGGTITGDLTVNGTITGNLTGTASNAAKVNNLTVQTAVPANAVFTDYRVKTDARSSTTMYLAGSNTTGTVSQGTLLTDSGVYVQTINSSTNLVVPKINGYTLAAASAKGVDTSITASSTSTNLPTSKAVADLIRGYLPLSGGQVTGPVTFGSSVSVDELTAGDLVVNGAASFTNNLQANTINGVTVGNNPKFTDTVTTVTVTGSGNAITSMTASNGAITATKGSTFLTSYTETDPIFIASAAHEITSTDISNWNSKTSNTGTVTKVTAGTGLKIGNVTSGGDITTTGTINHINNVTAKTAAAQSAKTLTFGGTFTLYEEKYDAQGHITGVASYNMTMPANPNTHYTANLITGTSTTATANAAASTNGTVYLNLVEDSTVRNSHNIVGSGTVTVTSDANGKITINGSAHPTSLKNPNALTINTYNATTETSSGYTTTTYDGSVANQSINVAGNNAITKITSNSSGQLVIQRASGEAPETVTVKITATTSETAESADKLNLSVDAGSTSIPVFVPANTGILEAVTSIAYSLLPTGTSASTVAVGNHTHGNITSGGDITATAPTIASGDQIVINDHSASKITNGPTFDGSTTTQYLTKAGTWATPAGTYSLPLAANGTRGGVQIGYSANGKNYPVQLSSEKMYVNVPWENTTYTAGNGLRLNGTQFINTRIPFVAGTQTTATGSWTGVCNDITALYDGLTIAYWLPYAGSGNATLNLTINGTETGAKNCYYGGATRLTTHYGAGNIIYLTYHSAANVNGTNYEGWWAQSQYYSNDTGYYLRRLYSCIKAGANKVFPYTFIMQLPDGRWESIVTSSSTGTSKTCNTHGFLPGQVLLMYANATYNENAVLDTYRLWNQYGIIDHRYSFNTANNSTNGTTANKPIYLVGIITNGLFYLDTTKWWAQDLPTTADGKVYIYLGDAYDYYRIQFNAERPIYHYVNGQIRQYGGDAATVQGKTPLFTHQDISGKADKSATVSTVTYDSTNKKLTKTINGSTTDIVTVATLKTALSLVKGDVGLGNVDNTADANKRVKGANITTTANAVAYYTDTAGTFGSKASANGALYATSANGALNWGTLPVAQGGTGATSFTANSVIISGSSTTAALTTRAITNVTSGAVTASTNLVTANSLVAHVANKIAAASDTYVTIATDQTITANQKTFNGAIRWSSSANAAKYGAMHYDSTLEALVFSFA